MSSTPRNTVAELTLIARRTDAALCPLQALRSVRRVRRRLSQCRCPFSWPRLSHRERPHSRAAGTRGTCLPTPRSSRSHASRDRVSWRACANAQYREGSSACIDCIASAARTSMGTPSICCGSAARSAACLSAITVTTRHAWQRAQLPAIANRYARIARPRAGRTRRGCRAWRGYRLARGLGRAPG
ncbi:MAG: hypothetical protein QOF46_3798 [Paraburkholderia sp.]|nr:hypothetical protein [Paraburkholderia sp.]